MYNNVPNCRQGVKYNRWNGADEFDRLKGLSKWLRNIKRKRRTSELNEQVKKVVLKEEKKRGRERDVSTHS